MLSCRIVAVCLVLIGPACGQQVQFKVGRAGSFIPNQSPWQAEISAGYQAMSRSDYGEADRLMDQALAGVLKEGPYSQNFAGVVQQIASYYSGAGLDLKSESIIKSAIDAASRDNALQVRLQLQTALANQYVSQSREMKGLALFRQIITEIEKTEGANAAELDPVLQQASWAADRVGNVSEAESMLKRLATLQPPKAVTVSRGIAGSIVGTSPGFVMIRSQRAPFVLAQFYQTHRRFAEAEQIYTDAIDHAESPQEQIIALQSYTGLLRERRRFDEAEAAQKRVIAIREASSSEQERTASQWDRQNLVHLYVESGKYEAAGSLIEEQIARTAQAPASTGEYFNSLMMKLDLQTRQKDFSGAEETAGEMLSAAEKGGQPYQKNWALMKMAEVAESSGNLKKATQLREAAREATKDQQREWDPSGVMKTLADAQNAANAGNFDNAAALTWRAMDTFEGDTNRQVICSAVHQVIGLAFGMLAQKKQGAADAAVKRILGIAEEKCSGRPNNLQYYDPIIGYHLARGFVAEAKRLIDRWTTMTISARGEDSPAIEWILRKRIDVARAERNDAEVTALEEEILRRCEVNHGPGSQATLQQRQNLARMRANQRDFTRAEGLWMDVLQGSERLWTGTAMHASVLGEIADFYSMARQLDQAKRYAERAIAVAQEADDASISYYIDRLKRLNTGVVHDVPVADQDDAQTDDDSEIAAPPQRWFERTDLR